MTSGCKVTSGCAVTSGGLGVTSGREVTSRSLGSTSGVWGESLPVVMSLPGSGGSHFR